MATNMRAPTMAAPPVRGASLLRPIIGLRAAFGKGGVVGVRPLASGRGSQDTTVSARGLTPAKRKEPPWWAAPRESRVAVGRKEVDRGCCPDLLLQLPSRSAPAGGCSNNSVTEQRHRRPQDPTDHWITSFPFVTNRKAPYHVCRVGGSGEMPLLTGGVTRRARCSCPPDRASARRGPAGGGTGRRTPRPARWRAICGGCRPPRGRRPAGPPSCRG